MRTAVIVQARIHSTRLPEKIFSPLGGTTLIEQLVRRAKASRLASAVVVACPTGDVEAVFDRTGIAAYGGSEKDLLSRLLDAAVELNASKFVRVTADCPLVCPRMLDAMIGQAHYGKEPVVVNWKTRTFPNGADLEVYDTAWLLEYSRSLTDLDDREWYASYIIQTAPKGVVRSIVNPNDLARYRLTVDYPEDLELVRHVYTAMKGDIWDMQTIVDYLQAHPEVTRLNRKYNAETGARPCS